MDLELELPVGDGEGRGRGEEAPPLTPLLDSSLPGRPSSLGDRPPSYGQEECQDNWLDFTSNRTVRQHEVYSMFPSAPPPLSIPR